MVACPVFVGLAEETGHNGSIDSGDDLRESDFTRVSSEQVSAANTAF